MSMLNVENIQKSFGKTEVLKDISFSLEKGEVLAITGINATGKTTILEFIGYALHVIIGKERLNSPFIKNLL